MDSHLLFPFKKPPRFRQRGLPLFRELWNLQVELLNGFGDDFRHQPARRPFVIRGKNVPGGVAGACGADGILIRFGVLAPARPFGEIPHRKLPLLGGIIEAFEDRFEQAAGAKAGTLNCDQLYTFLGARVPAMIEKGKGLLGPDAVQTPAMHTALGSDDVVHGAPSDNPLHAAIAASGTH